MGFMANTLSMYQYTVKGDLPKDNMGEWVRQCLEKNRFEPIDLTPDPESVGWVRYDDHMNSDFASEGVFRFEDYFLFTLRQDIRKVPAALLKNLIEQECVQWLKERPKLSRVPQKRRAEIRDDIHSALMSKTLPSPSVYDVLWDTKKNIVSISSISTKILDKIEDEFAKTFEGLALVPIHPAGRAKMVIEEDMHQALDRLNQASSNDVLLQIKKNKWLGWDFFLWLMYQSSQGTSEYRVNQAGPAADGDLFISYVYDRFVLVEDHEDGVRKSSITGPQKDFTEARRAVRNEKNITEALVYFEKDGLKWKINLKGDIFSFGSFASPPVKIEKDEITDADAEREAVFYERMYLLETGIQLFNSLFAAFLMERIAGKWSEKTALINAWVYQ
ncbi:MAG TPA: recombination-associated protein RdgC [Deltaproteobacteria bacterium]|nr:recombination-associated protein RdgC [Deltaproteobacteria bacterium]